MAAVLDQQPKADIETKFSSGEDKHAVFESNRAQESNEEAATSSSLEIQTLSPKALQEISRPEQTDDQTSNEAKRQEENSNDSLFIKYIKNPNTRNIAISTINAVLHGVAAITSLSEASSEQMKSINAITDKAAFFFTRWFAPIVTYGSAALNAFKKKDFAEMFIKLIPPVILPFTGDANVDTVYGLSSSLNQPYDMASKRVRENSHESQDHRSFAENKGNPLTNLKLIFQNLGGLYKDLMAGKLDLAKQASHLIGCPMIMAGSLPIMLFARNDRDSNFSRMLGLGRNIGGMLGDIGFMAGDNIYKKSIGVLFLTAALSSIAKRWVGEKASRIFIHLSSALDLTAYSIWNAFSETIEKHSSKDTVAA